MRHPTRRLRIGIYNETGGAGIGGAEYVCVVLANALRERHAVQIIHHHRDVTSKQLEAFSGLELDGVELRYLQAPDPARTQTIAGTFSDAGRRRDAELTGPYDVFVNVGHGIPPRCHAAKGICLVLFPFFKQIQEWPWSEPPRGLSDLYRRIRNAYYSWAWRQRLRSYQTIVAISEFTRTWTRRYWGVDPSVVYPPVTLAASDAPKQNTILSVGRFATRGHKKRHRELIETFARTGLRERGWSYECVGAVGASQDDRDYFCLVKALGDAAGVTVRGNVSRLELNRLYGAAQIFMHAAGYDERDDQPEMTEHFGIATVEAMSAGCIPLVIAKGAQPEIVEHGKSGFVWRTLPELEQYLRCLNDDEARRKQMSEAAKQRARAFDRRRFVDEMMTLLGLELPPQRAT